MSSIEIRSRASDNLTNFNLRENPETISTIADDISPIITQSQKLFSILQACAVYAASDTAVELWLDNERGRRSLAADMTDIANSGYDALTTNIRYFQDIRLTAESLARDGGTLDMLSRTHGSPEALSTHNRLIQSLQTQVRKCEEGAEKLEDQMKAWQREITKMQKEVISIHGQYRDEKNEYDKDKEVHEAERERAQTTLDQKLDELETQMKIRAERSHNKQELTLSTALALWSGDWAKACVHSGKLLWAMLPGQSGSSNISREEIGRRRQEALASEANLTEIQITIEQIASKTAKVEDFNNALKGVTMALALMIKHLKDLVGEFQESLALTATFAEGVVALETNFDYSSEKAISRSDSETFFENVVQMRDRARQVQYLALLYARIIKTVMLTGCDAISSGDYGMATGGSSYNAMQFASNQLAITSSNTSCISIKQDVDRAYLADRNAAARSVAQRREVFQKASEVASKPKPRFSLFRVKR